MKTNLDIVKKLLPEYWKASEFTKNTVVITAFSEYNYCYGYVTVDFEYRCFRLGMAAIGQPESNKAYRGRGWKEGLITDAISRLKEVVRD
jgi:hypothetical protein